MDFHIMKRKELQALCKKHNIPANLTNLEMANNLDSLLKEKEKPKIRNRSCLKNMGGMVSENDLNGVTRQSKKVRFSPENEMIEFVGSVAEPVEKKKGARRRSITRSVTKNGGLEIDIEASEEIVENPVRTTRSRAQKSGLIPVFLPAFEKKRTRNGVRSDNVSVVDLSDNLPSENGAVEETRAITRKSLRHREVVVISEKSREVGKDFIVLTENQIPRSSKKKNLKNNDDISKGNGLEEDGEIVQPKKAMRQLKGNVRKELAENEIGRRGRRTTRSQTHMEDYREFQSREVEEDFAALTKNQTLKIPKKKNLKKNDEISKGTGEEDDGIIEPEKAMGRSKRNVIKELAENEMARSRRTTRSHTQMADSKTRTETEVEAHKKLQMVQELEEPSRWMGRNGNRRRQSVMPQIEKVGIDGSNIGNERRKVLRREKLEETDMSSISSSRNKKVANRDGMDKTVNTTGKNKPLKRRRRDPESSINTVLKVSKVPNDSAGKNRKEISEKSLPNEASVETAYIVEDDKALETENSVEIPAFKSVELQNDDHEEKEPLFCFSESEIDQEKPLEDETRRVSEDDLAPHSCKRSRELSNNNLVEPEPEPEPEEDLDASIDVGFLQATSGDDDAHSLVVLTDCPGESEIDQEKPLEDETRRVNEDDLAPHSCKRSRELSSNNLVEPEPEEGLNASIDVGSSQATSGDDDAHSLVVLTDCPAKPSDNLDVGEEMDRDGLQATHENVESSGVVPHHGVDDDKSSILRGHNLAEFEDNDSAGEPINPEFAVEDHLAESNENGGTKDNSENLYYEAEEHNAVDLSDGERIRPTKAKDRETNVAEKSAVRDEEHESSICSLSTQNMEMETLSTTNVSAFKSAPTTDPGLSELEVTDNTNIKGKGSSKNSNSKKLQHLMEDCSKSAEFDEIRSLMMVNLEATPASNCVKLQSDSAEQERCARESLVVTGKENILLVASNQNLLESDMQKSDEYDLASRSPVQSGYFEDQDKVGIAFRADGFSPVHQAEHVAKPSRGVSEAGNAAEDEKCVVLEVQKNFIEFQEVCRFSESSTPDRISMGHSAGSEERKDSGKDCENTSENGVGIMGPTLSMVNVALQQVNANLVEGEEKSEFDTGVHHETMSDSDAFSSDEGRIFTCKKIEEVLAERDNQSDGLSSVRVASYPVNEETSYEFLEESSSRDGCIVGPLTDERENSCFETNSIYNSAKIVEASTNIFTNGNRILISMERDTDKARDIVSPIITKESSLVANNAMLSFECTSLKDGNSGHEDEKSLLDTPANDTQPSEQAASSHELDGVTMREDSTISNVKNRKINHECTPLKCDKESGQQDEFKTLFATPTSGTKLSEEAASSHEVDGVRMQEGSSISNVKTGKIIHEYTVLKDNNESKHEDEFKMSLATLANDTKPIEEVGSSHEVDGVRMPEDGSSISNVKNGKINHECSSLKDDNECGQEDEFKTLIVTPANDTKPSEEATSSHEVDGARMQEGSTISNVKSGKINHEEPREVVGLTENNDEKMAYKNAAPTANEEVTGECSDVSPDAQMGVDGNIYTAFDWFISNDDHVGEDQESDSLKIYENASKEDTTSVEALQFVVEAGISPISEREIDKTEYAKDGKEGNESIAKTHGIGADIDCQCSEATIRTTDCLEYQALGNSDKGMSFSELRISVDNEMRDEGMGSGSIDFMNVLLTQSTTETSVKDNGKSIEEDLHLECNKLDIKEINVEYLVDTDEYWGSRDCKELVAQENDKSAAGLAESQFKKCEVSERNITAELIKSTTKCINSTHLDASDMLSDKNEKENLVFDLTEAPYDHKDSNDILGEDIDNLMLEHDDETNQNNSKISTAEFVANRKEDEDLMDFGDHNIMVAQKQGNASEFGSANHEYDEDEISVDIAETELQVKKMELDDLDSDKDDATMEQDLNITNNNSYAEEVFFPQSDGQESDSFLHHGALSSDAEGREETEVDQAGGFTVPSLVSEDCNEDRGNNASTSLNKPFQEDKDAGPEKDAPEKDAFVDETMGYGASELGFESNMFSCWEMNLFLGDELMNSTSEASETHFKGDEVFLNEEKDEANYSNARRDPKDERVEVDESSILMDDVISTDVSDPKCSQLAASIDSRVEEGGSKSSEEGITKNAVKDADEEHECREERVGESTGLCENAQKANSIGEERSSEFAGSVVDRAVAAKDLQMCSESELPELKIPVAKAEEDLNSTTMKKKNAQTSWIQGTPMKPLTDLDMRENESSIKRENSSSSEVMRIQGTPKKPLTELDMKENESSIKSENLSSSAVVRIQGTPKKPLTDLGMKENESSIKRENLNSAVVRTQGTPKKPLTDLGMKENESSIKRENLNSSAVVRIQGTPKKPLTDLGMEENESSIKRENLNSSAVVRIQGTPKKPLTDLDMKENESSIKRENLSITAVRSTTKRRALAHLQNQ